jgi:hypothetical protein
MRAGLGVNEPPEYCASARGDPTREATRCEERFDVGEGTWLGGIGWYFDSSPKCAECPALCVLGSQ